MSSRRERISHCQVRVFEKCDTCGGSGSVKGYHSYWTTKANPRKWGEMDSVLVQSNTLSNLQCTMCHGTGEYSYLEGEHDYQYTSEHAQKCTKCGHKTCDP